MSDRDKYNNQLYMIDSSQHVPFDPQMVKGCMEEAGVPDVNAFKEILTDKTGQYPEENCLRKCLYVFLGLINKEGIVNVSFLTSFRDNLESETERFLERCGK